MGSVLPFPQGQLTMEYVPREQFVPFHKRKQRHAVLVTHRRCGKTVASICDLVGQAVQCPVPAREGDGGRFAYIAPTYALAKDVAWEMLKAYSRPFWRETPNESELRINLWNGVVIRLYGSDNPDALRGLAFNEVVLDEYADCPPSLFPAVIRPALSDRQGRVVFIGTVRGRENHLWQTYTSAINDPEWYHALLPASATGLIPQSELAAARRDMGEYRYASEFECDPDSPIVGAYYGEEMRNADLEGRVVPDLEIIDEPIHTAWDLGHDSNMAVFAFQIGDDSLLIHDFIQEAGWFFNDYIREVKERGYYGKCFVPHDIAVKDFDSGRTRIQTMVAAGLKPVHVPMHKVEDRINAAKLTLPRCRFNSTKCERGLAGLRGYCSDWDERLKVFKNTPKHDQASHAADAFGYMAMGWKQPRGAESGTPPRPLFKPLSAMSFDEYDDEIEITWNGEKIIQAERRPRRPDRV
jgi:phage terminase large subunit